MHLLKKILIEWPSVGIGSIVKMWIGACHSTVQNSSKLLTSHSINIPSLLGPPCPSPLRPFWCHPPPTCPSLTCWLGILLSTIPTPCFWTSCSLCLEMISPSWPSSLHSTSPSIGHHFTYSVLFFVDLIVSQENAKFIRQGSLFYSGSERMNEGIWIGQWREERFKRFKSISYHLLLL